MNVIFLYLSGIFIVLLLILIPMCMKFKARWLRGLASWLAVNMAAMLTTFVPFAQADPLVRSVLCCRSQSHVSSCFAVQNGKCNVN